MPEKFEDKPTDGQTNLIHMHAFRHKKAQEQSLSRGRQPLYISYGRGQVSAPPSGDGLPLSDFSERIAKIRHSLEKINALMQDLKSLSSQPSRGPRQGRLDEHL